MSDGRHLPDDWFPAALPRNVEIGEGSWLHSSFAFLHCRSTEPVAVRIGRACGVYIGSFFDLGPRGNVTVGDYSTLVGVIVSTNGTVSIGDYCFLAHDVVIADSFAALPRRAADPAVQDAAEEPRRIRIGDDVWIGVGAVVTGDIAPYAIVAGNPAAVVGWSMPRPAS